MARKSSLESATMAIIEIAWRVIVISIAIYLTLIGITNAYRFGHGLLYDHAMEAAPGTQVELEITLKDDRNSIGEKLEKAGLIDNLSAFQLQSRLYKSEFEPGVYSLNSSMRLSEILSYLSEEGKKLGELKEKNLVSETTEAVPESTEEILGGGDEVAFNMEEVLGGGDEG